MSEDVFFGFLLFGVVLLLAVHQLDIRRQKRKQKEAEHDFAYKLAELEQQEWLAKLLDPRNADHLPGWYIESSKDKRAQLTELRRLLEANLKDLAMDRGLITNRRASFADSISALEKDGYLTEQEARIVNDVRQICNSAVHDRNLDANTIERVLAQAEGLLLLVESKQTN
jgi:hypothetical protein